MLKAKVIADVEVALEERVLLPRAKKIEVLSPEPYTNDVLRLRSGWKGAHSPHTCSGKKLIAFPGSVRVMTPVTVRCGRDIGFVASLVTWKDNQQGPSYGSHKRRKTLYRDRTTTG